MFKRWRTIRPFVFICGRSMIAPTGECIYRNVDMVNAYIGTLTWGMIYRNVDMVNAYTRTLTWGMRIPER